MAVTAMIMSQSVTAETRVNALDHSSSSIGSQVNATSQGQNNYVTGRGTGLSGGNAINATKSVNATSINKTSAKDVGNSISGGSGQNATTASKASLSGTNKVNSITAGETFNAADTGGKGISSQASTSGIDVKYDLEKTKGAAGSGLSNQGSYLD